MTAPETIPPMASLEQAFENAAVFSCRQNQRKKFEDMKLKSLEMASDEGRQELLRRYSSL
jgi:hypothetical protein